MSKNEILISPGLLERSYNQLFSEQIPEVLFYQRDRPHYYNLLLKIIILFILLSFTLPLTVLPVFPFLSILLNNNFDIGKALGGGVGKMNLHWIGFLYFYYLYLTTNTFTGSGGIHDSVGGGIFISTFMLLTPISILLTWYYAQPVSIHDFFSKIYNSASGIHPLMKGGIAFSNMRCPSDTITRLEELGAPQSGGVRMDKFNIFGFGISDLMVVILIGILLTLLIIYIYSLRCLDNEDDKLNTNLKVYLSNTQRE